MCRDETVWRALMDHMPDSLALHGSEDTLLLLFFPGVTKPVSRPAAGISSSQFIWLEDEGEATFMPVLIHLLPSKVHPLTPIDASEFEGCQSNRTSSRLP